MNEPSPTYLSHLRITFGTDPEGEQADWRSLTDVTDATDPVLAELRRRVVEPVVSALLTPQELEEFEVHRGEQGEPGRSSGLWVRLVADGEVFVAHLGDSSPPDDAEVERCAAHLADLLQDWICETRFGWGQLRVAEYTCPR